MIKVKRSLITGNIKVSSTNLMMDEIEAEALNYLEKGYEVVKSLAVGFIDGYYVIFSAKPNPNSPYLTLKRTIRNAQEAIREMDLTKLNPQKSKETK